MKSLVLILCLILLAVVMQLIELRRFRTTTYQITSEKVQSDVRLVLLADLHGFSYGKENRRLLAAIKRAAPDVILIAGDLIVSGKTAQYASVAAFCQRLTEIAPVFFSYGNHESRAACSIPEFAAFAERIERSGVNILNNAFSTEPVRGTELFLYGLELPLTVYQKRVRNELPEAFLAENLGPCPEAAFTVLLAHDPAFGDDYFAWGADLIVSGHTHGGLVRFPGGRSILSPELTLFPKYDGGHYEKNGQHLIVSKGLGTHTFHIRIFDRAEVVAVLVKPQS